MFESKRSEMDYKLFCDLVRIPVLKKLIAAENRIFRPFRVQLTAACNFSGFPKRNAYFWDEKSDFVMSDLLFFLESGQDILFAGRFVPNYEKSKKSTRFEFEVRIVSCVFLKKV